MNSKKKILLVEDEAVTARSTVKLLEARGYSVIHAESGEGAVELIKEKEIDLVLMDIDLGEGMDGTAAAEKILEIGDIPVVFLSNHTEPEIVAKTEKITSYGYVVKNTGISVLDVSIKMAFNLFDEQKNKLKHERAYNEIAMQWQLLSAMEASMDGMAILNENEVYTYLNNAHVKIYGYSSKDELLGKSWKVLYDKEELARFQGEIMPAFFEQGSYRGEAVGRKKDGSTFPQEVSLTALPGGGLVCVVRDISERKKTEESLQRNEKKFREFAEFLPQVVFETDKNAVFTFVNRAGLERFGYTKEDIEKGMNAIETIVPEERERAIRSIAERFRNKKKGESEYTAVTKGGKRFPIKLYIDIVREDDEVAGIRGILIDITEEKRLENEIKASEERYRALHNATFGGIAIHDKGIILDCNEGLSQITGFSLKELLGMDGMNLIAPDLRDYVMNNILLGYEEPYEAQGVRKDGQIYPLRLHAKNIPYRGRQVRVVEFRDISDQKKSEEALLRAMTESEMHRDKAERANKEKSRFLASVSHEIRTPLNSLIGMTDLAKMSSDKIEQDEYLSFIKDAGRHLLRVINDIIDISKLEAGKIKLNMAPFNLSSVSKSVYSMFKDEMEAKGLTFQSSVDEGVPPGIMGDKVRLRQVLINLVGNAMKFTESGDVRMHIETVSGEFGGDSMLLRFSVSDTGCGISQEEQEKIFAAFDQGQTHSGTGGAGLGLYISRDLVAMMGGELTVESEPGRGSVFSFTIPVELADGISANGEYREKEQTIRSVNILLGEDNVVSRKVTRTLLEKAGHRVATAVHGGDVIKKLKEEKYDLILMDIEMPVLNGLEAAKMIREGEGGKENTDIPIAAMTAHSPGDINEQCSDAGIEVIITKPVEIDELKKFIGDIIEKRDLPEKG